ncbi:MULTISPECIES: helix-turn-helix transcriptional regulator [unclassified Modestobacter]|uniref:helix-turn-helix transcriptional regulator n=1 Tax=unclassified Modestobacter TaxID=2643866 RepID=UPI0022AA9590|nr:MULTISPECIES: metalloregulator ArsR/SmtB family transcription factor [unclassified Modestobacter]MCZ2826985.1 transcriptional regulator [Modestobacter sp. VKM Ac-2981]MCZ2855319.1 transcriptional regulator [Modestobacter sp. VKM Ac-2982]
MESVAARAAVPSAGAPAEDGRTRDRVSSLLLEHGPQTATELAARLRISPAAVRRHLDGLVAAGRVTEREAPGSQRGRGRPARRFALTDAGRESFPHAYDDLALTALRFVAEHGGPDAVRAVAEQQLSGLAQRCSTAVESALEAAPGAGDVDRAQVLAVALTAEGYAATASAISSGGQLCQHHCPVAHVAAEFPQLCEAETAVISRLVGTHVQRLATIAHGDGICTTHIPAQLALRAGLRAGSQAGNKATPARPVPAGRATPSGAGASTRTTPSIDRERTPA